MQFIPGTLFKQELLTRAMATTRHQREWPKQQFKRDELMTCVLGGDFNMDLDIHQVNAAVENKYDLDQVHGILKMLGGWRKATLEVPTGRGISCSQPAA